MISYHLGQFKPLQYSFQVRITFMAPSDSVRMQLAYWRPGRYEGGNFSRNIIGFEANQASGQCQTRKLESGVWEIDAMEGTELTVSYTLYTRDLTAGNTYADEHFLLLNPVNSLMYLVGAEEAEMTLQLDLPADWKVATSMPLADESKRSFTVTGIQQLLDTPIMAGAQMETVSYEDEGVKYHVHNCGHVAFDADNMLIDFHAFTKAQRMAFGALPVDEYHFLNLLLPHRAYNGVEHEASTVITLGPAEKFGERKFYKELLGISSHELYHTWNVKDLRPDDMTPYDFTKPNYSRLGYVAEGVTTYMGDYMLWQSNVFSDEEFLQEMSAQVQKHLDNEGRFNLSLADSSMDTWIDGYGRGTPRRRVSIYTEGALLALTCDLWILNHTHGEKDLSWVMRQLNDKFKGQKGYSESDYWEAMANAADLPWDELRAKVLDGRGYLIRFVEEALAKVGLEIKANPSEKIWESAWGVSFMKLRGQWIVWNVLENSPAEKAGLWFDDVVTQIQGANPDAFFEAHKEIIPDAVEVKVKSGFREREANLTADGEQWISKYTIEHMTDGEYPLFQIWKSAIANLAEQV